MVDISLDNVTAALLWYITKLPLALINDPLKLIAVHEKQTISINIHRLSNLVIRRTLRQFHESHYIPQLHKKNWRKR